MTILQHLWARERHVIGNWYSQQGGETACSDLSLLLWRGTLNFCAASVDTCEREVSLTIALNQCQIWQEHAGNKKSDTKMALKWLDCEYGQHYSDDSITYCEHSVVLPLLWKSIIHWISWLFSSSNYKRATKCICSNLKSCVLRPLETPHLNISNWK